MSSSTRLSGASSAIPANSRTAILQAVLAWCQRRKLTQKPPISLWFGLLLAAIPIAAATAQGGTPPAGTSAAASVESKVLKGAWVRPDGGYTIVIKNIGANGQLEAMYFNPNPLPFAKAVAAFEGTTLRASFELHAGGYDGSTYELRYDAASDRLIGVYYQAVAKQKFDVYFVRRG